MNRFDPKNKNEIEVLKVENASLKKKLEQYEQIFWDKNNEIAKLKRKIDKMKRGEKK